MTVLVRYNVKRLLFSSDSWRVSHEPDLRSSWSELSGSLAFSLMIVTPLLGRSRTCNIILDLPLEIQCEMFTHAHRDNSKNEPSRLPMEVILSHVCSEWRNISINLPSLWTAFKFDSHLRVSDPVKKLEEYLCRSGTLLLELYFSVSTSDYKYNLDWDSCFQRDVSLVELAIIDHACRWHRFSLFADDGIPSIEFMQCLDDIYVPNLEFLTLCIWGDLRPDPIVFIGAAPKLNAVTINVSTPFHLPPPLSNITTVAIQGTYDGIFFDSKIFTPS